MHVSLASRARRQIKKPQSYVVLREDTIVVVKDDPESTTWPTLYGNGVPLRMTFGPGNVCMHNGSSTNVGGTMRRWA
jgi:hypothetical protein